MKRKNDRFSLNKIIMTHVESRLSDRLARQKRDRDFQVAGENKDDEDDSDKIKESMLDYYGKIDVMKKIMKPISVCLKRRLD